MEISKLVPDNVHESVLIGLWFVSTSRAPKLCPPNPDIMYLWKTLDWHHGTVGIAADHKNIKDWPGYWETEDEALEAVRQYNKRHAD